MTNIAIEDGPFQMVIFRGYVAVYQRVAELNTDSNDCWNHGSVPSRHPAGFVNQPKTATESRY